MLPNALKYIIIVFFYYYVCSYLFNINIISGVNKIYINYIWC